MGGCVSSYENGDSDAFPEATLYKKREWQETNRKEVIKQINSGKIAKVEQGRVNKTKYYECPICFLYYKEVNLTKCCNHEICSECYLQLCPKLAKTGVPCPYCKRENFSVEPCHRTPIAEPPERYHHKNKKHKQKA